MARPSQTELAVLGALSTGSMTGYEVRAAIAEVLGHFWHESYGQIYPTLAVLEAGAAIRRGAPGRTSGSVFEITELGLARLRELLAAPSVRTPPRNGLLLRLFFGSHLPPGGPRGLLLEVQAAALAAQDAYAALRRRIDPQEEGAAYRTMTLSFGEHMARAQLAWAAECLEQLGPTR